MAYKGKTVEQLKAMQQEYQEKYDDWGGAYEFDTSINEISRALIEVFDSENEKTYLIRLNGKYDEPTIVDYETGKLPANFSFDYVCNFSSEELKQRIIDYRLARNGQDIMTKYFEIVKLLHDKKCENLFWA